jgi:CysZ protein
MLSAFARALAQLLDPAIFWVLILSVLGAVLVLVGSWVGVGELLAHIRMFQNGWLEWLARVVIAAGAVFGSVALFGVLMAAIAGLFVDRVARAVERRYYAWAPPPRRIGLSEQAGETLSFLAGAIGVNLVALPLYLIWGADIPIFLIVNGYLLGREYFELVALRHVDRATVRMLQRTYRWRLLLAGVAIAGFAFIPLADLLTPVVATAFMLHIFQGLPAVKGLLRSPAVR